jgi:hypothetical protein
MTDRYLKFILTLIACELLWIGIRDAAPRVAAQQQPMQVVVTGFRIGTQDYTTVPVAVVGAWPTVAGHRESHMRDPVKTVVNEPVRIDSRQPLNVQQPLTVQTGHQPFIVQTGQQPFVVQTGTKPLSVDVVPARPAARPGL